MSNVSRDFQAGVLRTGRRMDGSIPGEPMPRSAAVRLRRRVSCFSPIVAWVVAAACLLVVGRDAEAAVPQSRAVLIVNQSTALRPWPTEIIAGIQAGMRVHPLGSVSFYVEHLDLYS